MRFVGLIALLAAFPLACGGAPASSSTKQSSAPSPSAHRSSPSTVASAQVDGGGGDAPGSKAQPAAPPVSPGTCGPWLGNARLTLVSDDGGVRFRLWAQSAREMSADDAFAIAVDELRDFDLAERDDARRFVHWVDPCARPMAGFIQVKDAGRDHLVVAGSWPEGATERLRPVFADMVEDIAVLSPGACPSLNWLRQPGQQTFSAPRSVHADAFFLESNPLWACRPFVFQPLPAVDDGRLGEPDPPKPKEPFYW